MNRAALLIALTLVGCAPTVVGANSAGGTIDMNAGFSQAKAISLAEAECQKHGKVARSQGVNEIRNSLRYECVAP